MYLCIRLSFMLSSYTLKRIPRLNVPLELITSFLTITALETILAIDNLLFIYLVTAKLPTHQQRKAQITAISLAAVMRIVSLLFISLIMQWTIPLFSIFGTGISIKDMILIIGGLFLLCKALHEIYLLYRPKTISTQAAKNMLQGASGLIIDFGTSKSAKIESLPSAVYSFGRHGSLSSRLRRKLRILLRHLAPVCLYGVKI